MHYIQNLYILEHAFVATRRVKHDLKNGSVLWDIKRQNTFILTKAKQLSVDKINIGSQHLNFFSNQIKFY